MDLGFPDFSLHTLLVARTLGSSTSGSSRDVSLGVSIPYAHLSLRF